MKNIQSKLRETIKYPTSLIVQGSDSVGIELARSLLEQGGFVILIDADDEYTRSAISVLEEYDLFVFMSYENSTILDENIRRLDYVFHLNHTAGDLDSDISTQEFLEFSKFIDYVLKISSKYEAKFLLGTSIEAHRYLFMNRDFDGNFKADADLHTVYTEAELQRYAESLTHEYIQKSSLDARIIRIGQLLGSNIEVDEDTTLGRLLKESIKTESLIVYGDGLETQYYVHLQDAVYGIIKAQFAKTTRGETFSLAYEYEISTLSLTYKINEVADSVNEIVFSPDTHEYDRAIRLYKAAPNLLRVGWKPRVSFERALKQTYDYYSEYYAKSDDDALVERQAAWKNANQDDDEDNVPDESPRWKQQAPQKRNWFSKIFFTEKKTSSDQNKPREENTEHSGALGRLIAERKSQENNRKGSILIANKKLLEKYQQKQESRSVTNEVRSSFLRKFDSFMSNFDALRYITVNQFIGLIIVVLIAGFLYINVISIFLSSVKHLGLAYIASEEFIQASKEQDFETISIASKEISSRVELITSKFSRYELLSSFMPIRELLGTMTDIEIASSQVNDGIQDVVVGAADFTKYISEFDPNISYRDTSTSLLAVQNVDDYSVYTDNFDNVDIIIESGVEKVHKGKEFFDTLSIDFGYDEFNGRFIEYRESLVEVLDGMESLYTASKYIPELFGVEREQTYSILLLDNTVFFPAGGKPVSEVLITFNNGAITEIESTTELLDSIGAFEIDDPYLREQISLAQNTIIEPDEPIGLVDIVYLQHGELYLEELARIAGDVHEEHIDGVIVLNTSFLAEALEITGPIQYEDVSFTKETLVSNLSFLLQGEENASDIKEKILTDILAIELRSLFNDFHSNLPGIIQLIEDSIKNKNMMVTFFNTSNVLRDYKADAILEDSTDYISVNAIANDEAEIIKLPEIDITVDVLLRNDLSTRKTITIPSVPENLAYYVICLPGGTGAITFPEDYEFIQRQSISESMTCISVTPVGTNPVSFSFDTLSFANTLSRQFDYELGIRKQPGVPMTTTITLTSEGNSLLSTTHGEVVNENKVTYSETLEGDLTVGINLE